MAVNLVVSIINWFFCSKYSRAQIICIEVVDNLLDLQWGIELGTRHATFCCGFCFRGCKATEFYGKNYFTSLTATSGGSEDLSYIYGLTSKKIHTAF